jgi:hypothetical protein
MINWLPDYLAVLGLVLWAIAAYHLGGTAALLIYSGAVCLLLASTIAWKRSA